MRKNSTKATLIQPRREFVERLRATSRKMRTGLLALLATLAAGSSLPAHAEFITVPVDFTANQSLWGSGGSANVGTSSSGSFAGISYSYDIGASTGTLSAAYQGGIAVSYNPYLSLPGTTTFSLNFVGDANGGNITSDLGAWANISVAGFDILDKNYGLNIDRDFTPQLGQSASGEDYATIGGYGFDIGIASVGANLDLQQTDFLTVNKIEGNLVASLEGTATSITTPFSLTSSELTFGLDLNEAGTWDISFQDLTLDNSFSTSFDAALVLYEEHISGISFCYYTVHTWFGNFRIYYPCGVAFDTNSFTLADINVYNSDPFSLDFGSISPLQEFSILVADAPNPVPEPASWALLSVGLAGITVLRLRRQLLPWQFLKTGLTPRRWPMSLR